MRRSMTARALMLGALVALLVPATASADIYDSGALPDSVGINSIWVVVAGCLVMFMQAGFALVETGMTRAKNVAHTMGMNFLVYSIGIIGFWAFGFGSVMDRSSWNVVTTQSNTWNAISKWTFGGQV